MRALVTGGAGFIGSNLVDALVARGDEVVVLDDLSTGYADNVPEAAELVKADLCDEDAVRAAVAGCDVVFHEAAHRAVFRSVEKPIETDRANVVGTLTLLVAARDAGVRRVVTASSSSIYGGAAPLPTREDAPPMPRSPYAVTKMTGEHYLRVFTELYGMESVALRYFNVYGPRQRPDSQYAAVIPLFIDALRDGRRPLVHGDGTQSRDFTYVSDVVRANLIAAEAPADVCSGKAYNIAGGNTWTLLDLLAISGEILGVTPDPVHVEARAGDIKHSQAAVELATRELGFTTEVEFPEGLARTIAWMQAR